MKHTPIPHRCPCVSSSGSDSDTPLRKKQNTENIENMAELTIKEVNLQDLYTILVDMKSSQDQLKKDQDSFQTIVKDCISSLEEKLENKLDLIHQQFKSELNVVRKEIEKESKVTNEELKKINSRVDQVEMTVRNQPEKKSTHNKLIFKNIKACDIENTEDPLYIRLYVEKILREIELETDIEKIEVLNVNKGEDQAGNETGSDRKQPRLVIAVYFRNTDDK